MAEQCYHCGDQIVGKTVVYDEHPFCCNGCKSVYQLLEEHSLHAFYDYEQQAGTKPGKINSYEFDFLDVPEIRRKYIDFEDAHRARVTMHLPDIHCSSCIYLLENIHRINPHIQSSFIQFTKKEASFQFDPEALKLSELAELLSSIGYKPRFGSLGANQKKADRSFLYKMGIAGFAFGSIMLWTFPEYLGLSEDFLPFRNFTSYLSLLVSIPVLLYSASDYFKSAWKALQNKYLNLDVPVALGIITLYGQSLWSILNEQGSGYMDSFSGFIFFLLIGKWFQQRGYQAMNFERDYSAYFPVAVQRIRKGNETELVEIDRLEIGEHIRIRNDEIVPCDAILLDENAQIDYSFVTGESVIADIHQNDHIYAGGKIIGQAARFEVLEKTKRSQLTRMWNMSSSQKEELQKDKQQRNISRYFLTAVLVIALISAVSWFFLDQSQVMHVVVSVLIVTCPCALALSAPFTYGNMMRLLGRKGLYLKNADVVKQLNQCTDIVFDKTGTLSSIRQQVHFEGKETLNETERCLLSRLCENSTHPHAQGILEWILKDSSSSSCAPWTMSDYLEQVGKGISANFHSPGGASVSMRLGTSSWIGAEQNNDRPEVSSYLSINGTSKGRFIFESEFPEELKDTLQHLRSYQLHVLTGDKERDLEKLQQIFPETSVMKFRQSPEDKYEYVKALQAKGSKVLMLGDGLNDSGALHEAWTGIAICDELGHFSPSSDAITDRHGLILLPDYLKNVRFAKRIMNVCLIFSALYNLVGLSFAVSGQLSPLVAAILMPLSSLSIVLITSLSVWKLAPGISEKK
ncbi:MAG: HAD family hydrolase [Bacteroidetes bacterium]|nr:MAG: HAD family hydrolase [Bacteroidota bacterium]